MSRRLVVSPTWTDDGLVVASDAALQWTPLLAILKKVLHKYFHLDIIDTLILFTEITFKLMKSANQKKDKCETIPNSLPRNVCRYLFLESDFITRVPYAHVTFTSKECGLQSVITIKDFQNSFLKKSR